MRKMFADPEFERLALGSETNLRPSKRLSVAAHRALSDRRRWRVGGTETQLSAAELILKYQQAEL